MENKVANYNGERNVKQQAAEHPLPLMALNHVSRLCRNVKESVDFYAKVLGSKMKTRFNSEATDHLDPMENHISFQCEDMEAREEKLKEVGVQYMKRTVEDDENGTAIDQLLFNDPDGYMIEICNCENLKLVPAGSLGKIKLPFDRHNPPVDLEF